MGTKEGGAQVAADAKKNGQNEATKKGEENSSQNEANQKDPNTGAQVAADAKKNGQNEATQKGEEKSSQNESNKQEAAPKAKTEAPQNKNIPGARSSLLEEGETGFAT